MPESGDSSGSAVYHRRPITFKMEEEGHRRALSDQGQREEVVFLQDILPIPKSNDLGARSLPSDRVQEPKTVLTHIRGRGIYGRIQFRKRE